MAFNTLNKKVEEFQDKATKFDEYKNKCEQFDNIRNQLEREIHDLKETNKQKENMINEMNEKIKELSGKEDFSQFKEKYEEMTVEYEKEKERLTKLYQLYEETDFELKRLKKENHDWQNWYNSNKICSTNYFLQFQLIIHHRTFRRINYPILPIRPKMLMKKTRKRRKN